MERIVPYHPVTETSKTSLLLGICITGLSSPRVAIVSLSVTPTTLNPSGMEQTLQRYISQMVLLRVYITQVWINRQVYRITGKYKKSCGRQELCRFTANLT
jgi:hypothetical protein